MRNLILSLCVCMLLAVPAPKITSAASSSENYTLEPPIVNSTKDQPRTPSEIEAAHPMSAEAEAAIVHVVPQCPVIIDGVWYTAEQINLFDGQRLRFTVDKAGVLYAFTTVEDFEYFIQSEYGRVFDALPDMGTSSTGLTVSYLHTDMWYEGGVPLVVVPGGKLEYLGVYNNAISSAKISDTRGVMLYEYEACMGSSYYLPPGTVWSMLIFQGWNDRASSLQG
ncbi:MAG: hypothetical protein P3T54_05360 [Dehalogenimonas sp.]|uniref:Uncharacterized protein n=1 Tax=Candidatus Dehalogenimonas loeffleri TaxID=3127115 RepID=A0ABZ2J5Z8_9CHLR|nr:hypothetical protein [Dehalogenimonas sp.]